MGGLFGGGNPNPPAAPPPPPPVPSYQAPDSALSRPPNSDSATAGRAAGGFESTIIASPDDLKNQTTTNKTLTGS